MGGPWVRDLVNRFQGYRLISQNKEKGKYYSRVGTLWVGGSNTRNRRVHSTPGGARQENASLSLGQLTQPGTE